MDGVSLQPWPMLPLGSLCPPTNCSRKATGDVEKTEELEEYDDELDEDSVEMFPERVRSATRATLDLSLFMAQKMSRFSRAALWIGTTSFMILVLPIVFETEKLQMEQQQLLQAAAADTSRS